MSEATKIKSGVLLECDCGLNHKITLKNKELVLKTTYSKKIEPETTKKGEEENEESIEESTEESTEESAEKSEGSANFWD